MSNELDETWAGVKIQARMLSEGTQCRQRKRYCRMMRRSILNESVLADKLVVPLIFMSALRCVA